MSLLANKNKCSYLTGWLIDRDNVGNFAMFKVLIP